MTVDKSLLRQTKDKDPKVRRKAIVALADCRKAGGVEILAEIAKNDPEEKLRVLAERAKGHLEEQLKKAEMAADPETRKDLPPPEIKVSEKDADRAKNYMDEALSYYIAKDNAKATKSLMKALAANPTLKEDSYYLSMAGNILGVSQDEAVKTLMDNSKRVEFINTSKKSQVQKKKDEHHSKTDELTWTSVLFDLGVFTVVTAIISFLMPLVTTQMVGRFIEYQHTLTAEQLEQESMRVSGSIRDMIDAVNTVGVPIFLIIALATAVATAVSMMIQGGLVHLIATKVLGGVGTMRYMMCQILPFYSMTSLVLFVWYCIAMGIMASGAGIIGMICMAPMSLGSLVILFKVAGKIGTAYDFGSAKGCLSLIGASIVLALIASLPGAAVNAALQNWLLSAMGGV